MDRSRFVIAIVIAGMSLAALPASARDVLTGPVLTMNPNGLTPLAGVVSLTSSVPVRVGLSISGGGEAWAVEFSDYLSSHSVPVLGLKPATSYTIQVRTTDAAGNRQLLAALNTTTDPLPAGFPKVSVFMNQLSRTEPGYILLDKTRRPDGGRTDYAMIVDRQGEVRWYSTSGSQDGTRFLPNGRLMMLNSNEMDLLGNSFDLRTLQVPGLFVHHDMYPMQNGNFLSLALERVVITDFPTSETDPTAPGQTRQITSDAVVEFRPDGTVENVWRLHEMLDPRRLGYDAAKPGFPLFDAPDWSHSNAVFHDPADDSILVSLRHQDAIVKFSRATGQLIWILGPHDNWGPAFQPYLLQPVGTPFEWQFHQHAVKVTPSGTILLFDNGNYRASPFDGQTPQAPDASYSRAVEYAIDETTMQVRQVWEYGAQAEWRMFSASQGDADLMPKTGNIVLTLSDTRFMAQWPSSAWGLGLSHTAIIEVDHSTPPQKLFDMRIYDTDPAARNWIYRSERIPSLYPSNVFIIPDSDGDGVADTFDNCAFAANSNQRDTDHDGYGNMCDADYTNDNVVDYTDYLYIAARWQSSDANADLDGDGLVYWSDLQILVNTLFGPPGPSGVR